MSSDAAIDMGFLSLEEAIEVCDEGTLLLARGGRCGYLETEAPGGPYVVRPAT